VIRNQKTRNRLCTDMSVDTWKSSIRLRSKWETSTKGYRIKNVEFRTIKMNARHHCIVHTQW